MGAGRIYIAAYMPAIDLTGTPVGFSELYFYKDGTREPEPVFQSPSLDDPHPQPIEADANGHFPPVFADRSKVFCAVVTSPTGDVINHFKQRDHIHPGPLYPGDLYGAAPALPFKGTVPANDLVAFLGDSITGSGIENYLESIRDSARGMGFWVPTLTRQAFRTHQNLNFGVAGDPTASIAARVDYVLQSGAGTCVVLAGTNDIGMSLDAAKDNLATIFKRLTDANILTIAVPILPRSIDAEIGRKWRHALNHWLHQQAGVFPNFRVIDADPAFGDPLAPDGRPAPYCTYDGVHPMSLGSYYISRPVAQYLSTLRPARPLQTDCIHDVFEAGLNETGCLNQNPLMIGNGGQVFEGFAQGSEVANKWHIARSEGGGDVSKLEMSASKIIYPRTGLPAQRLAWKGDVIGGWQTHLGLTDYDIAYQHHLQPGDEIEFIVDLDAHGPLDGVACIAAILTAHDDGHDRSVMAGSSSVGDMLKGVGYSGVLRTPALALGPNFRAGSTVRCDIWVYFHNAPGHGLDACIDIISASVRKVVA